ncbi:MAG: phage holin family protein [Nocardioides sp.]
MYLLSILLRWVLLSAAVALAAWVVPDASLEGGAFAAMWVAVLIALANVVVVVILGMLPTPGAFWLLALVTLVVNGLVVWAVSSLTDYLTVDGFLPAVGLAIMISIFSMVLTSLAVRLLDRE